MTERIDLVEWCRRSWRLVRIARATGRGDHIMMTASARAGELLEEMSLESACRVARDMASFLEAAARQRAEAASAAGSAVGELVSDSSAPQPSKANGSGGASAPGGRSE